jgi:hypothetical protein
MPLNLPGFYELEVGGRMDALLSITGAVPQIDLSASLVLVKERGC